MPTRVWSSLKQTSKPMTSKLLLAGLAVGLLTNAHAQPNPIDSFFCANYNVPNLAQYANRQVGQVSYVLVDLSEYADVHQRYLDGGYVKLGESAWESNNGVPDREGAISYARFLGADAVVYVANSHFDYNRQVERTEHHVGFYALASSSRARVAFTAQVDSSLILSTPQATTAFNWLQDTLGKPHVRSVIYDAKSDSYIWIGPKYGKRMSMSRAQFLAEIWSGYLKFDAQ
jgi:hypothetical protein